MAKGTRFTLSSLEDAQHLDEILKLVETEPRKAKQELKKLFQNIVETEAPVGLDGLIEGQQSPDLEERQAPVPAITSRSANPVSE